MAAMGEELLSAIVAEPDDDDLRFRYAEWLADRDGPRAELIRIQCRLRREHVTEEQRATLFEREAELLYRFGKPWAVAAGLDAEGWIFERGFIERGNISFEAPVEAVLRTLKTCPVRHLRDISQLCDLGKLVAALPLLDRLTGLELGGLYSFDDALLAEVLRSEHLRNLKTLIVHHDRNGNLADEQMIVDALMSPHRSNIEVLGINIDSAWRGPSNRILMSIADSPYLRRLERLHIPCAGDAGHAPRLDVATVRRPFDSPNLQHLQTLDLRGTHATTEVWNAIIESPIVRRLRVLYLNRAFEVQRSGRQQMLRDDPRWREVFEERVANVDWSWDSIGLGDGTWPADPVERRRDEMRQAMLARPLTARSRTDAARARPSRRRIPVLAVRGMVIFPDAVERVVIGRPQSIMTVDAAIAQGGELVVAAQKTARTNAPTTDDIHRVGTLCSTMQATALPDGTRVTLLAGRRRVRIEHLESSDTGLSADAEEFDEPSVDGADVDALMDGLRVIVAALPKDRMRAEAVDLARTTLDPRLLADVISASIWEFADRDRDFAIRQELLEMTDPTARLERLRDLLR